MTMLVTLVSVIVLSLVLTLSKGRVSSVEMYNQSGDIHDIFSTIIQDAYSWGTMHKPVAAYNQLDSAALLPCPAGAVEKQYADRSTGQNHRFCFRPNHLSLMNLRVTDLDLCAEIKSSRFLSNQFCVDLSSQRFLVGRLSSSVVQKSDSHSRVYSFLDSVEKSSLGFWVSSLGFFLWSAQNPQLLAASSRMVLSPIPHPLKTVCAQVDGSMGGREYAARCLEVSYRVCRGTICSSKGEKEFYFKQTLVLIN
jgi:hypothetical protein